MNTPKLWSSVHIPLPLGTQNTGGISSQARLWFEAAESAPMEVSLWSSAYTGYLPQHPITACIASHSFHIHILKLNVSGDVLTHFYPIRGGSAGDDPVQDGEAPIVHAGNLWPVLEKVVLDFGMKDFDDPEMRGDDVQDASFWLAPRVKSVTLISVCVDIFDLPLKWDQLEEIIVSAHGPHDHPDQLDYQSFTPGEAKHLLKVCPKLSLLSIVMSGRDYESPSILPPSPGQLTHHRLTELHLEDIVVSVHSATFLKDLQLPSLKTLTYHLMKPQIATRPFPDTFDSPLLCFLAAQDAPVPVTTFKLSSRALSLRGLVECMKLMPNLEALRIRGEPYHQSCGDEFLEMLHPRGMRGTLDTIEDEYGIQDGINPDHPLRILATGLCPRLHDFIIDGAKFSPDGIVQFVRSRLAIVSGHNTSTIYARPRRFYVILKEQLRPDFVARDASGGTSFTEETLRALGVDAKIVLKKGPLPALVKNTDVASCCDGPLTREPIPSRYDPKRGLPTWYGGDADGW